MSHSSDTTPSSIGDFYAEHVHAEYFSAPEQTLERYRARVIRELMRCGIAPESLRGKVVFDIGSGFQALVFHELGCKIVYHADISRKQVAWLRDYCVARGIGNVLSDCVDVAHTLGRVERFDLAFVFGVIHHVAAPGELLLNLRERAGHHAQLLFRCYRSGTWSRWLTAHLREAAAYTTPSAVTDSYMLQCAPDQCDERFVADMRDDLFVPIWGAFHPRQFRRDAALLGWNCWTDEPDFDVDYGERDENFRVRFDTRAIAHTKIDAATLAANAPVDQRTLIADAVFVREFQGLWHAYLKRCAGVGAQAVAVQLVKLYRLVRRMRRRDDDGVVLLPPENSPHAALPKARMDMLLNLLREWATA
jgi:2-polyprenyl-3-methyl-5-hydroxy-6-metoxy-1,4-benzoquinol methylase